MLQGRFSRTDRDAATTALVGALAAVVAWLRLDAPTRGAVWAEDGRYLEDRLQQGPSVALFEPYQGYLHVLPRFLVEVAALLPLRWYALAVTALCCLTVGLVAALVHLCCRDVVESRAARIAVAMLTVLVPTAPVEVLGNAANLHWFLLWLTPWILLFRPTRGWQGWALGGVMLVVALSEIQAAMFLPLLLVRARDRRRWPIAAGLVLGTLVQVAVVMLSSRSDDSGTPTALDLVQGYGLHVFLQMWLPAASGVGSPLVEHGWALVVAASMPFLLLLAWLGQSTARSVATRKEGGDDDVVVTATLLAGATVPWLAAMLLNFKPWLAFADFSLSELAAAAPLRYAVVPSMFVLAAVAVVADRLTRGSNRGSRVVSAGLLVGLLGLCLVHLDVGATGRTGAPAWADGLAMAEEACRADAQAAEVPIAPVGWEVTLSCGTLNED